MGFPIITSDIGNPPLINYEHITMRNGLVKGSIVEKVLDISYIEDSCDVFESTLTSSENIFVQVMAKVISDENVSVVFTIPSEIGYCFITVSDSEPSIIRNVLSNVEKLVLKNSSINLNDVIPYEDDVLDSHGISALVSLPISVSGVLNELDKTIYVADQLYRFIYVGFLSRSEYRLWKNYGMEALATYLDESDKDLITFDQSIKVLQ